MSTRYALRVENRVPAVPLHAASYNPALLVVVFGVFAIVLLIVAIAADGLAFRLSIAAGALAVVVGGLVVLAFQHSVVERSVRIDPDAAALRFVAPATVPVGFAVLALVGLIPALLALIVGVPREAVRGGIGLFIVGLIALGWLAQQAWSLRTPRGLELSERGIRGVRGSKSIDLAWDQLARVEVVSARGAKLVFHSHTGAPVVIEPRYTGSDPNVVVPIIEYFLAHPEQRAALADPAGALRLVQSA